MVVLPSFLLIVGVLIAYDNGLILINNPSIEQFPIRGVDISSYQGSIDWQILAQNNIKFAYIKASEGSRFVDERFKSNWNNAQKTNLRIGAYHFLSFDSSGADQADNFVNTVPFSNNSLPPAIDIEFYKTSNSTNTENDKVLANLSQMINKLKTIYLKEPLIYVTNATYEKYIKNHFINNQIWIRDVLFQPKLSNNREWLIWQYSDKNRLKGYSGDEKFIDMNIFNGNIEKLQSL